MADEASKPSPTSKASESRSSQDSKPEGNGKTTLGTSSFERAPQVDPVAVPRVGAPDPVPDAAGAENTSLTAVGRDTLEAAAKFDEEARQRTEEALFANRAQTVPPVTHADQNAEGNVAPNNQPMTDATQKS